MLQAEVASVKAAMQKRVEEAVAETEAKASGLRDAREKNVHFSARVVALNARVAAQQKDLRNLTAINASLTQELEELRSMRSRPAAPLPLENGAVPFSQISSHMVSVDVTRASLDVTKACAPCACGLPSRSHGECSVLLIEHASK